jgi:hypothetical protein
MENPLRPDFEKRPSGLDARKVLLRRGHRKGEDDLRQAVLEFGIGVFDVGFGFLEFGLGEFHDGAETKVVAGLRQGEREVGLFAKLLGDGEAFEGAAGVLPGVANVASDVVAGVEKFLALGFGLEIGSFGAGVVEEAVEDRNVDVHADGAVPARDVVVADWSLADDAEGFDSRAPEIVLGAAEFLRGLDLELERLDFGTLDERFLDEGTDVRIGLSDRSGVFDELEILLVGKSENGGKVGERDLIVVLGLEEEELGAGEFDIGKTEIDFRLQFGVGEGLDFVDESLAGTDGFLRDSDKRFGFERIVKGLVDNEQNVGAGGGRVLILGFGAVLGAGKQIGGAAEIGDELADSGTTGGTGVNGRVVESTSGNAAAGVGIDGRETEVGGGQQGGANFADVLLRGESAQFADGNLRIVFDGDGFGLLEG